MSLHEQLDDRMSSPAPLLRPPVPGARNNGGPRTPRLTLGIPPSPNVKPVNPQAQDPRISDIPLPQASTRPTPPQLRIATPMGSNVQQSQDIARPTPYLSNISTSSSNNLTDASNGLSTSSGTTHVDGKSSGPVSASSSSYSTLSFAMGLRQPNNSTPGPSSAISSVYSDRDGVPMERDSSVNGLLPDLDKLSLDMGRPLDVEDLDDEGWLAASEQKKIVELGSLGEGAGGAVTRCKLKDGNTIFALKVHQLVQLQERGVCACAKIADLGDRSSLPIRIPMSRNKSSEN